MPCVFLFVKQHRSPEECGLWYLPARDYINQSIYFPRDARHKSPKIPIKLNNRGSVHWKWPLCFFCCSFCEKTGLLMFQLHSQKQRCPSGEEFHSTWKSYAIGQTVMKHGCLVFLQVEGFAVGRCSRSHILALKKECNMLMNCVSKCRTVTRVAQ